MRRDADDELGVFHSFIAGVDPAVNAMRCAPRNFLRSWLLLMLKERPDYGYHLVTRLCSFNPVDDAGAVYRTLRELERTGLARSGWQESTSGPARRVYALTARGDQVLSTWAAALRETYTSVGGFLAHHDRVRTAGGADAATTR